MCLAEGHIYHISDGFEREGNRLRLAAQDALGRDFGNNVLNTISSTA